MKKFLIAAAVCLQTCACTKQMSSAPEDVRCSKLTFNLSLNGYSEVKSAFSVDENYIEKMSVWIYNDETGLLEASKIFSGSSVARNDLSVSVRCLKSCSVFFLANCDAIDTPQTLSMAENLTYFPDRNVGLRRAFPMSAVLRNVDASDDVRLDVGLDRLVARYNFRLDCSQLKGRFELVSVEVKQAAADVTPFKPSKASSVGQGDFASELDLRYVMNDRPVPLYMLENCRGNLSAGNASPWSKIPADRSESERSTYIEVHARYESPTLKSEDLTYRMFLGKDNLTNYDICRNGVYTVTLVLSDLGITVGVLNSMWKMDPGEYELTGELKFAKKTARCAACYEAPFIRLSDGRVVAEVSDTVDILRSSPELNYSLSYNPADYAQSGVRVSDLPGRFVVSPVVGRNPDGLLGMKAYSYDALLSDSMKVFCGIMDLNIKFEHSSGELVVWSSNGNPAGVRLKIIMDYGVYSSASGGRNFLDIHTYYDQSEGRREYFVTPSSVPESLDEGLLCATIRNLSDGFVPHPSTGIELYRPYLVDLGFTVSSVAPDEMAGRTLVRLNSEIFNMPSSGFVHNETYMGQWYLEYEEPGRLRYYKRNIDEVTSSMVDVNERFNGVSFNAAGNRYTSAVFEI